MKIPVFTKVVEYFRSANQWFADTPERALDQAYDAALMIKAIEDEHFDGNKVSTNSNDYGNNVSEYFQIELQKYLTTARVRLAEFKASKSLVKVTEKNTRQRYTAEIADKSTATLEKLKFIDEILDKYTIKKELIKQDSLTVEPKAERPSSSLVVVPENKPIDPKNIYKQPDLSAESTAPKRKSVEKGVLDKTGVLPRSILGTLNRIKTELDPRAEDEVVKNFRSSKLQTIIALRFILLLILVPLLTQQISKNFLIGPIVDHFRNEEKVEIFLNPEMEEEAFMELQRFEERLKFRNLINAASTLSTEEMEIEVKKKAEEIAEEFRHQGSSAIKNVFSDLLSLVAFGVVIFFSKREIAILKSFIDEIVYGLSDSAKAFIIILFTDVFVGFHSPHGWEVILEGLSRHLGLPANRDFIFLFIATFPVILDTVFKYWIFRYLNRISPSAVATYRNMNE
jgi:hypothetical protein